MIEAIIFDLDGTLIHSLPGLRIALNETLTNNGLPTHEEAKVRNFIGDGIYKLVQRAVPKDFSKEKLESLVTEMSQVYGEVWQRGSNPFKGVTEILNQLNHRKIPIGICSNKPDIFCQEIANFIFPNINFDAVLGQREGFAPKPDPASALATAKKLSISPEKIAFIGDSTMDLETAHRAGMIPIAVTWGYHNQEMLMAKNPAHTLHTIEELLNLI